MADRRKVPELRFKGFEGEWEERTLNEVSESIEYGLNAPAMDFDGHNKYLRITDIDETSRLFSTESLTTPNVDLNLAEKYKLTEGDILFARTGASVGKTYNYKQSDGLVYYAGFLIRARIRKSYSPEFIFSNTLTNGYNNFVKFTSQRSGQPGINAQEYGAYLITLPSKAEQFQIGTFFQNLDSLITLNQRKHDKLITVKKAMLQKMFPKEGADVPEIRFKGFTEKWERRTLGEIVTPFAEHVPTPKDGYWRLGIRSHAKGTFHSFVQPGKELETAKMHKVAANNLIVNITFAWEHAVAITNESDDGKLVSHRFPQFSFNDGMVPEYFKFLILDKRFKYHLWLSSPGGAGRNRVLKISEMLDYPFWVPDEAEQTKIANFMQNLDSLITLQQRELDKLKNIKKACLEKMFI